jgi:chaperone LolA
MSMRIPFVILLTASAAAMFGARPARATTLDEVINGIQKVYGETRNFKASFDQKLTLRATKRKRRAGGRVYFQKPAQFRFVYTRGEKKRLVSDGKRVWTYVPEDAQVRIDPFSPKLAASLRFLWGEGNLREQFDARALEKSGYGREGDHVLELVPKVDEGHYKKLVFVVDPKTFDVRETIVHDPVGNVNHMRFRRVQRNADLKPSLFTFKPPKGAEVIESPELKQ